ncbi:LOW QUALITY PROTEIN: hypothetical protein HID58_024853 [Brassica napus]|uniref:DUF3741 domain-containing protein n=1 Tax=Brassica napus TaxID=3708 RepID=A0ABQ8CJJ5_BRANA|nr:LOW QUALITY PROTEIN: hypothetical protein HID58_024853 [Brassica napus]
MMEKSVHKSTEAPLQSITAFRDPSKPLKELLESFTTCNSSSLHNQSGNSVMLQPDKYTYRNCDEKSESEVMFAVERGMPERASPTSCLREEKTEEIWKRDAGTDPVKKLLPAKMASSLESWPMLVGKKPVNSLEPRSIPRSLVKLRSPDGKFPLSLLYPTLKMVNCFRLTMEDGTSPMKPFEKRTRLERLESSPSEDGILPEKLDSERSSPLSSGLWSSLMDCKFGIMKTLLGNSPIRDLRDDMYENSWGISEEMFTELISNALRFLKFLASRGRNNGGFSMDKSKAGGGAK